MRTGRRRPRPWRTAGRTGSDALLLAYERVRRTGAVGRRRPRARRALAPRPAGPGVPVPHDRAAPRRGGRQRRHPGALPAPQGPRGTARIPRLPPLRRAVHPRPQRLLLPDGARPEHGRVGGGVLRARPAQVRQVPAPVAVHRLHGRPDHLRRGDRRGPRHHPRGPRFGAAGPGGPFDGRPHRHPVGAPPPGRGPRPGPELRVAGDAVPRVAALRDAALHRADRPALAHVGSAHGGLRLLRPLPRGGGGPPPDSNSPRSCAGPATRRTTRAPTPPPPRRTPRSADGTTRANGNGPSPTRSRPRGWTPSWPATTRSRRRCAWSAPCCR